MALLRTETISLRKVSGEELAKLAEPLRGECQLASGEVRHQCQRSGERLRPATGLRPIGMRGRK